MPIASYNAKISKRGEAAREIAADATALAVAVAKGTPADILKQLSVAEKEAKDADQLQRKKQAEAKQRGDALDKDYAATQRDYTEFRQRRETRKSLFTETAQSPLLAAMTASYARKIQVERVTKEGKTVTTQEDSEAVFDRLSEISSAVGAVLAHPALVKSFAEVSYGEDRLNALQKKADAQLTEAKEIHKLRKEAEAATRTEQAAAAKVNELWKLYGPGLRRAAESNATIEALLQGT